VASVDPESTTTISSTSVPSRGRTAATTPPTVASSSSAGRTTDTVRPARAAVSSAAVHVGRVHVRRGSHRSVASLTDGPERAGEIVYQDGMVTEHRDVARGVGTGSGW
jgi:hypothetical protein